MAESQAPVQPETGAGSGDGYMGTHSWPADSKHMFEDWKTKDMTTQYRRCVHPDCHHFEIRETPKG